MPKSGIGRYCGDFISQFLDRVDSLQKTPILSPRFPVINMMSESDHHKVSVWVNIKGESYQQRRLVLIDSSVYSGAQKADKRMYIPAGTSTNKWKKDYYSALIFDSAMDYFYSQILFVFQNARDDWKLNSDEYLELIVRYVQGIPYDTDKAERVNTDIQPRFPIETVVDNKGICMDKSLLLAGLLSHEGYAAALMEFPNENHIGVGIPVTKNYDNWNTGYAMIETTTLIPIGDISGQYISGMTLTSVPNIIPVGNGKIYYNGMQTSYIINQAKNILVSLLQPNSSIQQEIRKLQNNITNNTTNSSSCNSGAAMLYSQCVERYNQLVAKQNRMVDLYQIITNEKQKKDDILRAVKESDIQELQKLISDENLFV